jgi:hypothetical protein
VLHRAHAAASPASRSPWPATATRQRPAAFPLPPGQWARRKEEIHAGTRNGLPNRSPERFATLMIYTMGQAARATGKAKPTIARAIQAGRLSAPRTDDGSWSIDPAELHRVFAVTRDGHPRMERSGTLNGPEPAPSPETLALRQLLA